MIFLVDFRKVESTCNPLLTFIPLLNYETHIPPFIVAPFNRSVQYGITYFTKLAAIATFINHFSYSILRTIKNNTQSNTAQSQSTFIENT